MSATLSKIPLAARENRPWTVVSGNESGLDGGKVAGDGNQPEPYVRGLNVSNDKPAPRATCPLTPSLTRHQIAMRCTVFSALQYQNLYWL